MGSSVRTEGGRASFAVFARSVIDTSPPPTHETTSSSARAPSNGTVTWRHVVCPVSGSRASGTQRGWSPARSDGATIARPCAARTATSAPSSLGARTPATDATYSACVVPLARSAAASEESLEEEEAADAMTVARRRRIAGLTPTPPRGDGARAAAARARRVADDAARGVVGVATRGRDAVAAAAAEDIIGARASRARGADRSARRGVAGQVGSGRVLCLAFRIKFRSVRETARVGRRTASGAARDADDPRGGRVGTARSLAATAIARHLAIAFARAPVSGRLRIETRC
jgi:hypothetical protein